MTTFSAIPIDEYCRELDWPVLPDSVCDELIEYVETQNSIWENNFNKNAPFSQYLLPNDKLLWIKNYLSFIPDEYEIRLQKSTEKGLTIHKDHLRAHAYNFVLTIGDDSSTNWYADLGVTSSQYAIDPNLATLLYTKKYKPRTWYQHQSQVYHNVTDTKSSRIAITIFKFELQKFDWNLDYVGDRTNKQQVAEYLKNNKPR